MDECRRFVEIPASFGLVVLFAVSKCDPYKYKCVCFGQASLKLINVHYAAVQFNAIATEHFCLTRDV